VSIIQICNCGPDLAVEGIVRLLGDLGLLKDPNTLILEEHDMEPPNFGVSVINSLDMRYVFEGQRDSFTINTPEEVSEILG
jgi:hypothetical protein